MNRNKSEYEQGYRDGHEDGVEVLALALACRLHWPLPAFRKPTTKTAADQAAAFSVFASLRLSRSSFPARTSSMALPMPLFSLVSVT